MNRSDDDRLPVPDSAENDRLIDRLFRSEAPRLARFIRRSVRNQDEVHDLVQDTFVSFVEARPKSRLRTPAAYLRTIARGILWERIMRPRAYDRAHHVPMDEANELCVDPEQEWMMEASDFMRRYEEALSELPPRTREVFRLHRQDELTYQEIAERIGITVDGVKYHMKKALLYLDHRVNPNG
jgi:RNA polymerase sigma factor (sigma-70 family)